MNTAAERRERRLKFVLNGKLDCNWLAHVRGAYDWSDHVLARRALIGQFKRHQGSHGTPTAEKEVYFIHRSLLLPLFHVLHPHPTPRA